MLSPGFSTTPVNIFPRFSRPLALNFFVPRCVRSAAAMAFFVVEVVVLEDLVRLAEVGEAQNLAELFAG
ncbi:hypothetical protein IMZ48_40510 [Candidatus Bathyarchaeota archaeon]|nr:hypothetical protein [Candidatus Bathyarchaeota archaeon]